MKARPSSFLHRQRFLFATLALSAAAVVAAPRAEANTGAGATILNTIKVDYKDASGTTSFSANATAKVTVNVVKAAVTTSGMPTTTNKGTTASLPAGQTVNSGSIASYLIAVTANANGGDTYNLSELTGATSNVTGASVAWSTVKNDGTTVITGSNPASVALGASVIQANGASSISIPGGSNLVANLQTNAAGFKVVVVNGIDYIVSSITPGTAPSNTHVGGTLYSNLGTATAEALDVITLAANPFGANVAPAFTANALIGQQVGEQILIKVDVTGVANTLGTAGQIPFTFTVKDSSNGNAVTTASITTTFRGSNLQIRKTVRNCGTTGGVGNCSAATFAATATGAPGDILEYKVEVDNSAAGAGPANLVSAQDAVPVYTSLLTFTGAYGDAGTAGSGLPAQVFATVNDGTSTAALTMQATDTELANVAAGDAAGTAANSAIKFFLGTGVNNTTGGTVASGKVYTILYRMKMN